MTATIDPFSLIYPVPKPGSTYIRITYPPEWIWPDCDHDWAVRRHTCVNGAERITRECQRCFTRDVPMFARKRAMKEFCMTAQEIDLLPPTSPEAQEAYATAGPPG
jgi:hypothetical protein